MDGLREPNCGVIWGRCNRLVTSQRLVGPRNGDSVSLERFQNQHLEQMLDLYIFFKLSVRSYESPCRTHSPVACGRVRPVPEPAARTGGSRGQHGKPFARQPRAEVVFGKESPPRINELARAFLGLRITHAGGLLLSSVAGCRAGPVGSGAGGNDHRRTTAQSDAEHYARL